MNGNLPLGERMHVVELIFELLLCALRSVCTLLCTVVHLYLQCEGVVWARFGHSDTDEMVPFDPS